MLIKLVEKWWAPTIEGVPGAAGAGGGNGSAGQGGSSGSPGGGSGVNSGAPAQPDSGRAPALDGGPQPDPGGFDWGALGTEGDVDVETIDSGEADARPVEEPEPQPQPGEQQQEQQPGQQPQPDQQPQERQRSPGVQGFLEAMVEKRAEIQDAVANMRFQLSPEDIKAIEKDFVAELPKLASRVWFEAYTSSINWMAQQVPQMMRSEMRRFGQSMRAETDFYQAWPGLDRGKHHSQVLQFGRVYRQMYPQASVQEFIRDVGTMVATAGGLQGGYRPSAGGGGQQRRAQPAATMPGARRRVEVFTPAGTGGGGGASPGRRPGANGSNGNPFEGLGRDYEEDE